MTISGKEGPGFMESVYSNLGRPSKRVVVGPGWGLDNAVVSVGKGRVLIVTVDPVSVIPEFGMELSGWLSVHLIASDFTASGVDPEFATFTYNFPRAMSEAQKKEFVRAVGFECKKLGVAIVGGNTGTYPGAGFTVIGTGSMFGTARDSKYVTPSMGQSGDAVLMTKQPAIEAVGSLALSFPGFLDEKVGRKTSAKARAVMAKCTTVEDARAARKVGLGDGALTSMHDATEGGVLGGLEEMARASHHAFEVDTGEIPVDETTTQVCSSFGLDPLTTMGEGALLLTCCPGAVSDLKKLMSRAKIPVTEIGTVKTGEGLLLTGPGGRKRKFVRGPDRYWPTYERFVRQRTQ